MGAPNLSNHSSSLLRLDFLRPSSVNAAKNHLRCYNCHEIGHVAPDCPKPKMTICYNCRREGHKTYQCMSGKRCHICQQSDHLARECRSAVSKRNQNSSDNSSCDFLDNDRSDKNVCRASSRRISQPGQQLQQESFEAILLKSPYSTVTAPPRQQTPTSTPQNYHTLDILQASELSTPTPMSLSQCPPSPSSPTEITSTISNYHSSTMQSIKMDQPKVPHHARAQHYKAQQHQQSTQRLRQCHEVRTSNCSRIPSNLRSRSNRYRSSCKPSLTVTNVDKTLLLPNCKKMSGTAMALQSNRSSKINDWSAVPSVRATEELSPKNIADVRSQYSHKNNSQTVQTTEAETIQTSYSSGHHAFDPRRLDMMPTASTPSTVDGVSSALRQFLDVLGTAAAPGLNSKDPSTLIPKSEAWSEIVTAEKSPLLPFDAPVQMTPANLCFAQDLTLPHESNPLPSTHHVPFPYTIASTRPNNIFSTSTPIPVSLAASEMPFITGACSCCGRCMGDAPCPCGCLSCATDKSVEPPRFTATLNDECVWKSVDGSTTAWLETTGPFPMLGDNTLQMLTVPTQNDSTSEPSYEFFSPWKTPFMGKISNSLSEPTESPPTVSSTAACNISNPSNTVWKNLAATDHHESVVLPHELYENSNTITHLTSNIFSPSQLEPKKGENAVLLKKVVAQSQVSLSHHNGHTKHHATAPRSETRSSSTEVCNLQLDLEKEERESSHGESNSTHSSYQSKTCENWKDEHSQISRNLSHATASTDTQNLCCPSDKANTESKVQHAVEHHHHYHEHKKRTRCPFLSQVIFAYPPHAHNNVSQHPFGSSGGVTTNYSQHVSQTTNNNGHRHASIIPCSSSTSVPIGGWKCGNERAMTMCRSCPISVVHQQSNDNNDPQHHNHLFHYHGHNTPSSTTSSHQAFNYYPHNIERNISTINVQYPEVVHQQPLYQPPILRALTPCVATRFTNSAFPSHPIAKCGSRIDISTTEGSPNDSNPHCTPCFPDTKKTLDCIVPHVILHHQVFHYHPRPEQLERPSADVAETYQSILCKLEDSLPSLLKLVTEMKNILGEKTTSAVTTEKIQETVQQQEGSSLTASQPFRIPSIGEDVVPPTEAINHHLDKKESTTLKLLKPEIPGTILHPMSQSTRFPTPLESTLHSKDFRPYHLLPMRNRRAFGCCYVCDINRELKHHQCGCVCSDYSCIPTEFSARKRCCKIQNAPKLDKMRVPQLSEDKSSDRTVETCQPQSKRDNNLSQEKYTNDDCKKPFKEGLATDCEIEKWQKETKNEQKSSVNKETNHQKDSCGILCGTLFGPPCANDPCAHEGWVKCPDPCSVPCLDAYTVRDSNKNSCSGSCLTTRSCCGKELIAAWTPCCLDQTNVTISDTVHNVSADCGVGRKEKNNVDDVKSGKMEIPESRRTSIATKYLDIISPVLDYCTHFKTLSCDLNNSVTAQNEYRSKLDNQSDKEENNTEMSALEFDLECEFKCAKKSNWKTHHSEYCIMKCASCNSKSKDISSLDQGFSRPENESKGYKDFSIEHVEPLKPISNIEIQDLSSEYKTCNYYDKLQRCDLANHLSEVDD